MQRRSTDFAGVVEPVVAELGSDSLNSTIDVVVPAGGCVTASEHEAPTTATITTETEPIATSLRPPTLHSNWCIVPHTELLRNPSAPDRSTLKGSRERLRTAQADSNSRQGLTEVGL